MPLDLIHAIEIASLQPYVKVEAPQIGLTMTCENCEAYTRTVDGKRHLIVYDLGANVIRHSMEPGTWTRAEVFRGDVSAVVYTASDCNDYTPRPAAVAAPRRIIE